jgi:hypothetical protein
MRVSRVDGGIRSLAAAGRVGNPASSLSERRLDNLPLASPLNIQKPATFQLEVSAKEAFWKATTHQQKKHQPTEITKNRNGSRILCVFKTHYREPEVQTLEAKPSQ